MDKGGKAKGAPKKPPAKPAPKTGKFNPDGGATRSISAEPGPAPGGRGAARKSVEPAKEPAKVESAKTPSDRPSKPKEKKKESDEPKSLPLGESQREETISILDYHNSDDLAVPDWVKKVEKGGPRAVIKEFALLRTESKDPKKQPANRSEKVFLAHKLKNRYEDVGCWDQTRVRLGNPKRDFIHANFVDGVDRFRKWIVTQGPIEEVPDEFEDTITDFWRMVWERQVQVILMLCLLEEDGKSKCAEYWPETARERLIFGEFAVTSKETGEKNVEDHRIVVSQLVLQKKGVKKSREVAHYLHKSWPDRKCPATSMPIFGFLEKVHLAQDSLSAKNGLQASQSPIAVHCSAGIGRSGTLVAIDVAQGLITKYNALDILSIVRKIRTARRYAVQAASEDSDDMQTHVQYCAIYIAILEYLMSLKKITFDLPAFTKKLNGLLERL